MTAFKSHRVTHEYIQTNPAAPAKVFPLLCPVREADWVPGWHYRLVYSDSGVAELGCIFTTPDPPSANSPASLETTWIVTEYDPPTFRIAFVWIAPGRVITQIQIQVASGGDACSRTNIRYCYTGLSEEGNRELEQYDRVWFETKMKHWEATMNHYLRTEKKTGH
jgi:hypothetical protein